MSDSEIQDLLDGAEEHPEYGIDFNSEVVMMAFSAAFDLCGYDMSALPKEDQDSIFSAVIDAWVAWPNGCDEAAEAAAGRLWSIAVAGGWEEYLTRKSR